jgi:hypothetical protein
MSDPAYFVGIGAQKAGTTWLAYYLYAHDEVFMSPYKEMHYFDSKWLWRNAADNFRTWAQQRHQNLTRFGAGNAIATDEQSRWAHKLYLRTCLRSDSAYREFLKFGAQGKKAVGEITPNYTDLDRDGFRDIDRCLPGCKFILLVREPFSRFCSQVNMDLKKGGIRRRHRVSDLEQALQHRLYRRRGDYKRTLEELCSVVDKGRVLVVFFERLFDPALASGEAARICDHLGIRFIAPDVSVKKKVGRGPRVTVPAETKKRIVAHYADVYAFMERWSGGELPAAWRTNMELLA